MSDKKCRFTVKVVYNEEGRGICSSIYSGLFSDKHEAIAFVTKFFGLDTDPGITVIRYEFC